MDRWALSIVIASFYMLREVEVSNLKVSDLIVNRSAMTESIHLSVSKTDYAALGTQQSWACVCGGTLTEPCPYHAAVNHLDIVKRFTDVVAESN
eukprot:2622539-Amphidinium_carterae.1